MVAKKKLKKINTEIARAILQATTLYTIIYMGVKLGLLH
jgi:hypothetical protein